MKYKILLLTILAFKPIAAFCQWVPTNQIDVNDTLYTIKGDRSIAVSKGYHFPEYEFFENTVFQGFRLISSDSKDKSAKLNETWSKEFTPEHPFQINTAHILMRPFFKNIKSYQITLITPEKICYQSKVQVVTEDGYQIPIDQRITDWEQSLYTSRYIGLAEKNYSNFKLLITVEPNVLARNTEFTVADLCIVNQFRVVKEVRNNFFSSIAEQKINKMSLGSASYYSDYIISGSNEQTDLAQRSNIYLDKISDNAVESKVFIDIIARAIELYPFYNERKLDKNSLIAEFKQVVMFPGNSTQLCTLVKKTKSFLKEKFHDPHFGIVDDALICEKTSEKKEAVARPFRLYCINRKLYVASVFDQRYADSLKIGDEVIEIDHKEVKYLLDSLESAVGLHTRHQDAYEYVDGLQKTLKDSISLRISRPAVGQKILTIKYNGKLSVPKNFAVKNGEFKMIDGSTSYFQITRWSLDVFLSFVNQWDKIANSKKLVLDLRGNGGGTELSVLRLLSVFIPNASDLYWTASPGGTKSNVVRLKPNPAFQFPQDKKVVVLCDQKTACASETFIQSLINNRKNVVLVGTAPTAGVLASRFDIHFPSGEILYCNSITDKMIFPKAGSLECKGISPDIQVKIETIKDLRPYDDLVLSKALYVK